MADAEKKGIVMESLSWVCGTLEGSFNEKQAVSQILVDAVIGMIPVVGDVTAVRDIIAIVIRLVDNPKKREEKMEWVGLVLMILALIPMLGGALKGVGRLLIRAGEDAAKESVKIAELIACLNRLGVGDARKWIKELDFEKHAPELIKHWHSLVEVLVGVLGKAQGYMRHLLPESLLKRIEQLKSGIEKVSSEMEKRIPESLKELQARLKKMQHQLYEGKWEEIPGSLKSTAREAEARMVEEIELITKKPPFPKNGKSIYEHEDGFPNILQMKNEKGKDISLDIIEAFSGKMVPKTIKHVHGKDPKKIFRIIEDPKKATGCWWTETLPTSGQEWREEFAVLDNWNKNKYYVEFVLPEGAELLVWEGKVSSQVDNVKLIDKKPNPKLGQALKGGETQIFVDFRFPRNKYILDDVLQKDPNMLKLRETNWVNYMDINNPNKITVPKLLNPNEIASKASKVSTVVNVKGAASNDRW